MQDSIFVSKALDEAMKLYNLSKNKKESLDYNKFLCVVIRMLVLIYGEELITVYNLKDLTLWESLIMKYGFAKNDYDDDEIAQYDAEKEKIISETKSRLYTYLAVLEIGLLAVYLGVVPLQKKAILKYAV